MNAEITLMILFLAQAAVPSPVLQLAQIERRVAAELDRLPDYTCAETVERKITMPTGRKTKPFDTLKLDVAFIGGKELYGKRGATIDAKSPGDIYRWGASSNGEFAGHLRTIFVQRGATIKYARKERMDGRNVVRWDYVVPYLSSGWDLQFEKTRARVGSQGTFWTDPKTLDLLRIEFDAIEIPSDFPVAAVREDIRYGQVRLGERTALLPRNSTLVVNDRDGSVNSNVTRFSQCREYHSQSEISFK